MEAEDLDLAEELDHIMDLDPQPHPGHPDLAVVLVRPPPGHPDAPRSHQWAPAGPPSPGQWADTWGTRSRMRTIGSIDISVDTLSTAIEEPEGGDSAGTYVDDGQPQQLLGLEPIQGRARSGLLRISSTSTVRRR